VASVRSCQKLPPCLIKPVPASSKMDPPLPKAKPVSDGGRASGITYLRRGKKTCSETAVERGVRRCERNNLADAKVSEEGGGGGARDTRAESFPLQLVMKTMVRQVVPLQSMEVHSGAEIHLPVERTPHWSSWRPEGGGNPMERNGGKLEPGKKGGVRGRCLKI